MEQPKQIALEEQQYKNLIESMEILRGIKHDMQNNLCVIAELASSGNLEELKEYVERYQNSIGLVKSVVSTGNAAVDSIITTKISAAQAYGIDVDYSVIMPKDFCPDVIALASLLGNMFDNAIQACQRCTGDAKCFLKFMIKPFKDMIIIRLENKFQGTFKRDAEGNFLSEKEEPGHGIGIRRMKSITEKLNDTIDFSVKNDVFTVHVMLPVEFKYLSA